MSGCNGGSDEMMAPRMRRLPQHRAALTEAVNEAITRFHADLRRLVRLDLRTRMQMAAASKNGKRAIETSPVRRRAAIAEEPRTRPTAATRPRKPAITAGSDATGPEANASNRATRGAERATRGTGRCARRVDAARQVDAAFRADAARHANAALRTDAAPRARGKGRTAGAIQRRPPRPSDVRDADCSNPRGKSAGGPSGAATATPGASEAPSRGGGVAHRTVRSFGRTRGADSCDSARRVIDTNVPPRSFRTRRNAAYRRPAPGNRQVVQQREGLWLHPI